MTGRVLDSENGSPVGLASIIVLDAQRTPLFVRAADASGLYRLEFPGPGEYYLVADRLGYFETETPLLGIDSDASFQVDLEMQPEPLRLDPLDVTVSNERLEDFLTLELGLGQHPATLPGYRNYQGRRLEEAKLKSDDNTELLRNLYIPVTHGREVCVGSFGAKLPERMGYERTMAEADEEDDAACGTLYVDGYPCPNEHIDGLDMDRIAVVVTLLGDVYVYTRGFDFTFRPGSGAGGC